MQSYQPVWHSQEEKLLHTQQHSKMLCEYNKYTPITSGPFHNNLANHCHAFKKYHVTVDQ